MPAGTPQDHLPLHIRWIQNLSRSVSGCSLPCCKRDDVTLAVSTVDAEACIRNITVVLAVYTTHADPSIAAEAVQVMIRVLRGLPRLRNAVLQGQASFARSQGLPDDHPEVLLHLQASKCTACSLPSWHASLLMRHVCKRAGALWLDSHLGKVLCRRQLSRGYSNCSSI